MASTDTKQETVEVVDLFETSLKELLKDKGFHLPMAREALLAASQMLEWTADGKETAVSFLSPLVSALELCVCAKKLEKKAEKEMWGEFHNTHSSKKYLSSSSILMKTKKIASPLFYKCMLQVTLCVLVFSSIGK